MIFIHLRNFSIFINKQVDIYSLAKLQLDEKFESDNSSLKKTGLKKLTTIHLDDNYDVVIHGANDIEKGYDEKRQKYFYKLFYDKEK